MWVRSHHSLAPVSDPEIRVGIVGAGFVSAFHLAALKQLPRVKVVGIADIILEAAEHRARQYGIPRYHGSLEELLEDEFDVLHVATPGPTHYELALLGLEADRHIFVEKPFTQTTSEADVLMSEAERRGKQIMVDHSLLCDPSLVSARKVIDCGALGSINSVQIFRCGRPPKRDPARAPYPMLGDPMREVGVHALYCTTSILGPIRDAQVQLRKTGKQPGVELDEWSLALECERGLAQIQMSWNGPLSQVINVRGDKGQIRIDLASGITLTRKNWPGPKPIQLMFNPIVEAAVSMWQVFCRIGGYTVGRSRWYQGLHDLIHVYYSRVLAGEPMPFDSDEVRNLTHWVERIANEVEEPPPAMSGEPVQSSPHVSER
jgi:predicted dehydrogenase